VHGVPVHGAGGRVQRPVRRDSTLPAGLCNLFLRQEVHLAAWCVLALGGCVYGATTVGEYGPGHRPPGPFARQGTAADSGGRGSAPPAFGVFPPERRKPACGPDIDPGVAFLGGLGISRRALYLASRLAAIRGTAARRPSQSGILALEGEY